MIRLSALALPLLFFTALAVSAPQVTSSARADVVLASNDRQETCLGNVCFSNRVTIGDATVPLRGVGLLRVWGFRVYTAAFYVPDGKRGIEQVLGDDVPRKLVLHYHRGISASDIRKSSEEFVRKNSRNDVEALRERLDNVYSFFVDVRSNDRYIITYEPGVGTTISFNDEPPKVTIEGADFARAFFGIWLSEEPIDRRFRDRLIGSGDNA